MIDCLITTDNDCPKNSELLNALEKVSNQMLSKKRLEKNWATELLIFTRAKNNYSDVANVYLYTGKLIATHLISAICLETFIHQMRSIAFLGLL